MELDIPPMTRMPAVDIASLNDIERLAILVDLAGNVDPIIASALLDAIRLVLLRTHGGGGVSVNQSGPAGPVRPVSPTQAGFKAGFGAVFGIIAAIVVIVVVIAALNHKSPYQKWQDCVTQQEQAGNVNPGAVCGPHP